MIYFIQHENYVKIGYTLEPKRRVIEIQVSMPTELKVLLIIEGNKKLEKELHSLFVSLKTRGEWFLLDGVIEEYIELNREIDLRYEYGFGVPVTNELMPIRRHRIDCGLTLKQLGSLMGITKQGVKGLEQSANKGTIRLNSMSEVAKATGYKFEFRFVKGE